MTLSNVKPWTAIVVAVGILAVGAFTGSFVRDKMTQHNIVQIQRQLDKKDAEIKVVAEKVVAAEKVADTERGAKLAALKNYTQALKKIKALEQEHGAPIGSDELPPIANITPDDPCKDVKELLAGEHEARVAGGEALDHANAENEALVDANAGLHEENALLEEKADIAVKEVVATSEDRDVQVTRKKRWRAAAGGSMLLNVILWLLL